jgi:hypothetical protein
MDYETPVMCLPLPRFCRFLTFRKPDLRKFGIDVTSLIAVAIQARGMADPEIQGILTDPVVRQVLQDFQENPKVLPSPSLSHFLCQPPSGSVSFSRPSVADGGFVCGVLCMHTGSTGAPEASRDYGKDPEAGVRRHCADALRPAVRPVVACITQQLISCD